MGNCENGDAMANISKNVIKLATELVKYRAEKMLGKDALSVIVNGATDLVGESATEKIASFFGQGEQARKLLDAFRTADICFADSIDDYELEQAINSKPLAGLPKLETFTLLLPNTLDDNGLLRMLQKQFETDWQGRISNRKLEKAAREYRRCLDRSLAANLDQMLSSLYRIAERIDRTSNKIKSDTQKLLEGQKNIQSQLETSIGRKYISPEEKDLSNKAYLVHVISELEEWETRYAKMFAQFEKLTLFAQVKSTAHQPEPLLNLIEKSQKLVILGPAGSGKTTTTQKVTLENAQKIFRGEEDAKIPILVPLRDYGSQNIENLIDSVIKFSGLKFSVIEEDLEAGKYLLLFDGLNEIPSDRKESCFSELRKFLRKFPSNQYIFTSRTLDYQDNWLSSESRDFPICEIQSLKREQIESYIFRYFKDQKSKATCLVEELELHSDEVWETRKSLARLAGVPLLLQMLILTFEEEERIPRNEGELILRFVDEILIKREPGKTAGKFSPQIKKQLLANIARRMFEEGNKNVVAKRFAYSGFLECLGKLKESGEASQACGGAEIWQEIQNNHLLIEKDDEVYWPHPLYQELFVGLSFRDSSFDELWNPRYVEIETRFYLLEANWYGNPRFDLGITMLEVVPNKFRIQALVSVACINPILAKEAYLRLEPEYNSGLQEEFFEKLLELVVQKERPGRYYRNLVRALGYLRNQYICSPLLEVSRNCPNWEGRDQAVVELWMKCHHDYSYPGIINHLEAIACEDDSQNVRKTAISKLITNAENTKSDDDILLLVDRVMSEAPGFVNDTRILFSKVLNTPVALDKLRLIALNTDEKVENRCRAIWAIGKSGTKKDEMQQVMIRLAKTDTQIAVRKTAVDGLRLFSSPKTVRALHYILQNEQEAKIREKAVFSLDACKDNYVGKVWLSAIFDPDDEVGEAAIEVLFHIHDKRYALAHLIDLLKSSDTLEIERIRVLDLLSRIASDGVERRAKEAAKELSYHANEKDKRTRLKIARGLREYDVNLSSKILKDLCADECPEIRELAREMCNELGI